MAGLLSAWREWSERRQILRDIRRLEGDSRERDHFKVKDELTYALEALERGDSKYANGIWDGLMDRHPDVARESPLATRVLIGLRRYDEAEAMLRAGQKKHSNDPDFAKGLAEIAHTRRDFDVALERWAYLRKRFPGVVEGYTLGADAFIAKDQLPQAETLASEAIARFPSNIGGLLAYARIAVLRKDWEEALRRWETIRNDFKFSGGYVGGAQALCHLGRYDEADDLLEEARLRFGTDSGPSMEFARVAEARGDVTEALKRWKMALYRFPLDMHLHITASEAFERLGEPDEAEATLRAAIDRFPTELRPFHELAKLFHYKRRDFPAAAEAWAMIRQTFPDNTEAYERGAEALHQAGRSEEAEALRNEYLRHS